MLTAEAVLAYASPDVLAGLVADCQRFQEWDDDTADAIAVEKLAMTALIANVGDEEAAAMVARKIEIG